VHNSSRTPIAGTEFPGDPAATRIGDPDPDRLAEVTLTLRRRGDDPDGRIERAEFAERFGADPDDIKRVEDFAAEHGLEVVEAHTARRTVVVRGRLADLASAFGTELALYESPQVGTFRSRGAVMTVPSNISDAVQSVLGLDDRPTAFPRLRTADAPAAGAQATKPGFSSAQLAQLYGFPSDTNGTGQTVAIIELGGGYKTADLNHYWSAEGVTPKPKVVAVSVDGGTNSPAGDPNSADGEVALDIEVIGAAAPGARMAVYFAPNTTRGFLDAITTAIHDNVRRPSVVSISWGQAEDAPGGWSAQSRKAYDQAFQDAAALGVTVTVAAGDDGSADGVTDGQAHVDFPSASPYVLSCGGTKLTASATAITGEVVWHEASGGATGGGVSRFFALPAYQKNAHVPTQHDTHKPGRGVPDVAGDADPATGYRVRVDGKDLIFGGTSAVAPLWAALIARVNAKTGQHAGFVNPKLYAHGVLRDITQGNNGAYKAGPGWDACTGLGSPNGPAVLQALGGTATAAASASTSATAARNAAAPPSEQKPG
jgi:kumamolisin